jgi:hypothetical protein
MMNTLKNLLHLLTAAPQEFIDSGTHASQLLSSLLTMAWFVEARDPYTGGHLWRVSRYARLLAERAGMNGGQVAQINLGGFLHDLGKVGVPDAILRKTSKLTEEEYAIIRTHPDAGARMIAGHPLSQLVNDAVVMHHERPDGLGYPRGLTGNAIPDMALIVGICDAFDAMTSHRPYRPGMQRDKAIAVIAECRGTQFDRRFATIFIALGEAGELDHVMGHSEEGIPLQCCPMCGPTLVVMREHHVNDRLYCRNCASEFTLAENSAGDRTGLSAISTGRKGTPADLVPEVDAALIARTVHAAAAAMSFQIMTESFN